MQVRLGALILAVSQPVDGLTVPSTVAVRFLPPTSFAVIWNELPCSIPLARAIARIPSHEIMPVSELSSPKTTCQSSAGQLAVAPEWKL